MCKCKRVIAESKGAFRLAANMLKREKQLQHIFGGRENWPPELLLPHGTGPGKLGDVRVAGEHYRNEDLNFSSFNGKGAR